MNDRLMIASVAMEGMLIGIFSDRPSAKPTPEKIAAMSLVYADALIKAEKDSQPIDDPNQFPQV